METAGKHGRRMNVSPTTESWFIDNICRDVNRWLMIEGRWNVQHDLSWAHGRAK